MRIILKLLVIYLLCLAEIISSQTFTFDDYIQNPYGFSDVGFIFNPDFVDIDNDGDYDVFVGERFGNILFYENIGDPSSPSFFSSITNTFGLINVTSFASPDLVDIDKDGDFDAFIGNDDGNILFFENIGNASSPSFASPITNTFGFIDNGTTANPEFIDIDKDGDFDAFVGDGASGIFFYENIGNAISPSFASPITNTFDLVDVADRLSPVFVDLDRDGDFDIFSGGNLGNIFYFENTGNAVLPIFSNTFSNTFGFSQNDLASNPDFVDIDKDGDQDAFVGLNIGNVLYYENLITPNHNLYFVKQSSNNNPFNGIDVGTRAAPTLADFDGDGDYDAFIGQEDGDIDYFINVGDALSPTFSSTTNPLSGVDVDFRSTPFAVDIDYDGDTDIYIGNHDVGSQEGRAYLYGNDGDALNPIFNHRNTLNSNPLLFVLNQDDPRSYPSFVDIDNDGDFDAFIGVNSGTIGFYENVGTSISASFVQRIGEDNPINGIDPGSRSAPIFVDLDRDGDFDLTVGNDNEIKYYENVGNPLSASFVEKIGIQNIFAHIEVDEARHWFEDINNDGNLELIIGEGNGEISYYKIDTPDEISYSATFSNSSKETATFDFTLNYNTLESELKFVFVAGNQSQSDVITRTITSSSSITNYTTSFESLSYNTKYYFESTFSTAFLSSTLTSNTFWTLTEKPFSHSGTFWQTGEDNTTLELRFDAFSGITNADGYLIIRSNTSFGENDFPSNSNTYNINDTFGYSTVVANIIDENASSHTFFNQQTERSWQFALIPYNVGENEATANYLTEDAPTVQGYTIPTLGEWGMIAFAGLMLLGGVWYIRRVV